MTLYSQSNVAWASFWNKDSTLLGYKNKDGIVKIKPKFGGRTSARKFENIIAVTEKKNDKWNSYYLTKQGKIVGKDSVLILDKHFDCESEGFIRFKNPKTDKVGLLNRNGDIAITAQYDEITRVMNGLIIALKGATKKYWGDSEYTSWIGGKHILIDTTNRLIVDSFDCSKNIDFYTLLITEKLNTDTNRQNFKTVNGLYYSFVDLDISFNIWLKKLLLNNLTKEKLLEASYKEIKYFKEIYGWAEELKDSFFNRNYDLVKSKLLQLNMTGCDFNIYNDRLNPYLYNSREYDKYFNNCREPKDWIYPMKSIQISYYKEDKSLLPDRFDFLQTENGFKLISITIRNGMIK